MRKILIGMAGALAAAVVIALVSQHSGRLFAHVTLPPDDTAGRLAFALRWLLFPGLTLLVGVVGAARRGFYRDAIDGTRTPANHGLEINLRYNQNTLEQTVLAAIAWAGLALALPHDRLVLIPAMAWLFVIGRLTFWVGYLIYPVGRVFGMVLTVMPTLIAFAWLCWHFTQSA
ncbi:MAG TPA: MAPEG family protein [Rhizomicrobium sp.]